MPLAPLSRQQLHEVEALIRRAPQHVVAAHPVLDPFHRVRELPAPAPGGDAKATSQQQPSPPAGPAASQPADGASQPPQGASSSSLLPKSPALKPANSFSGLQVVSSNERTLRLRWGWKLADAALYFTWLACAPLSCRHCGAVAGGFQPDADGEYRCALCHATVGGGGRADIVDEVEMENDERGGNSDDEGAADENHAGQDTAGGGSGLGSDASVLQTVQFLLVVLRGVSISVPIAGFPQLLRAAATISQLLILPDTDAEHYSVLRAAALYVACSVLAPAQLAFPTLQRVSNCGLQWLDCIAAANGVGTVLGDFFDDPVAHTRNLMADLNPLPTPSSRLWDPTRSTHLQPDAEWIKAVDRPERHSPDHTSAIVVLEYCRRHPDTSIPLLQRWHEALVTSHPKQFANLATKHAQLVFFEGEEHRQSTLLSTLLCFFSHHFDMHPIELCRMATASGLFCGPTTADATLQNCLSVGLYPIPLMTRNSAAESPWEPVFRALHSSDRVILHSLLSAVAQGGASAVHEMPETTKTIQAILAKHGAVSAITSNYNLRVDDEVEKNFNGDYFCSSVTPDGASYVHLTKSLSIRFRAKTLVVYLNDPETPPADRRHTTQLKSTISPPTRLGVEGPSAKLLIDCAANRLGLERWAEAARRLAIRAALRRRMRANTSHMARVTTLLGSDITLSRGPDDIKSTVALETMREPPTVASSYATCDLIRDVPSLHSHLAAADTTITAFAAALQHVLEGIPDGALIAGSPRHKADGSPQKASPRPAGISRAGAHGLPPLELPPSQSAASSTAAAAAASTEHHELVAASAAKRGGAGAHSSGKGWRQLTQHAFGLESAKELRPLALQASGAIAKLRRRRAEGGDGPAELFVSSLESGRQTPRQPRSAAGF